MSSTPIVWMNGELMPADEVRVSPFDLSLTVGMGVFETALSYSGYVFEWGRHYARLVKSASVMGMAAPDNDVMEKAINAVIVANKLESARARVRVSLGAGVAPLHLGNTTGNVIVTAVNQPEPTKVASLVMVPYNCDENAAVTGVKSVSYANQVLALRHAVSAGADEALMLNTRNEICEGSMSNIFLVKNGSVRTPALSSGCLPGVTREIVMELCGELGIGCEECALTETDTKDADELFITSSVREVQAAMMRGDTMKEWLVTARIAASYQQRVCQS